MKNLKLVFANHETELIEGSTLQGIGFRLYFEESNPTLFVTAGSIVLEHANGTEETVSENSKVILQVGDVWSQEKVFGRLDYKILSID